MKRAKLKPHEVTRIIITATMSEDAKTVDQLQQERRSAGYLDLGFHYFVDRNARVHFGVPSDERGSYFERYGHTSIVILIDGKGDYEPEQLIAVRRIIGTLKREYPFADPTMHYELFLGINPAIDKEELYG